MATAVSQHVQGRYNVVDSEEKYAHIVGNGSSDSHSNAHTIDWEGNVWFAGNIRFGGIGYDDPNAKDLEAYINAFVDLKLAETK